MDAPRRWWPRREAKHRDAVILCALSSAFLLAGELTVPVLQEIYARYIAPVASDPLVLAFRGLLVGLAFTTSLGAILVDVGGWYFVRDRIPRGRFFVGLGVGITSLTLVSKISYYTLVYGTPLAYLVPLATSLTGIGIILGLMAHILMGRIGRGVRKHVVGIFQRWRLRRENGPVA